MPITVKARDGKTDIYGVMFVPTNFDPTKKYPIINQHLSGPADRQRRLARVHSRRAATASGLAELGFVVVKIDGIGTPIAVEVVPRRVLRQDGRQHASRSDRRR